jgi:hypothetical protein
MECRFLKPVYDGRLALVKAADAQGALDVTVESEGVLCATARAELDAFAAVVPSIDSYAHRPPPEHRPAADEASLAAGTSLSITPFVLTSDTAAQSLRDIREADPIYAEEGAALPTLLRNWRTRRSRPCLPRGALCFWGAAVE